MKCKIIYSQRFLVELRQIARFIALDSKSRAKEFSESVKQSCQNLVDMPYKCRKSLKFDDESVRDLICKGYVIPYLIKDDCINILGIYKENVWEAKEQG